MTRGGIAVALALLGAPGAAGAQAIGAPVDSGMVVRMTRADTMVRARLLERLEAGMDSVRGCRYVGPPCGALLAPGQMVWLRPADWDHLDVQVGTKSRTGAWIGGVTMSLLLVGGYSALNGFCESDGCRRSPLEVLVGSATLGALLGGGIGAIIGSAFPRFERRF